MSELNLENQYSVLFNNTLLHDKMNFFEVMERLKDKKMIKILILSWNLSQNIYIYAFCLNDKNEILLKTW